ncbi:thiamine phosphate synthase [Spirosoma sp. KUDC1026]|uniref:thiamine phosphate synthase n=1 Tax=Spirosoma sp. KUDC1026 TaxID=2745947 RepID=UPI00159BD6DB|nr:thiamine phosphate synthase [Spirosoma sp. KUDC1026]QKZ14749.1 thiamine phosphate synthase [Spirosoma sp. KUDC1026]
MIISPLHYLVTRPEQAELACQAGVDWIQLRVKNRSYADWKVLAQDTLSVCRSHNARLIINDNPQLAAELGADGVHLGQDDMPVPEARALLGNTFIIGGTANTLETIRLHGQNGADYVGLGPFRFTSTKEKLSPILGLTGYQSVLSTLQSEGFSLPIVAIGGITLADIPALLQAGLHGVAVSSAISGAANPIEQAQQFCQYFTLTTVKITAHEHP